MDNIEQFLKKSEGILEFLKRKTKIETDGVTVKFSHDRLLKVSGGKISVETDNVRDVLTGISKYLSLNRPTEYSCRLTERDKNVGFMLDCSRNEVMRIDKLKELAVILALFGYDRLMLYTEDTFEIEGEEYFGYMRGRYSIAEIRELDGFCSDIGMELVPCVQTLGHMASFRKWKSDIYDTNDILLADDEKTYEFLDKMFASLRAAYSTHIVNVGLDEAPELGAGKYAEKFGECDKGELFSRHLTRVSEIAKKYGFGIMAFGDMIKKFGADKNSVTSESLKVICWDYYSTDKQHYLDEIDECLKTGFDVVFAGGAWKWCGFIPMNRTSIATIKPALEACAQRNIKEFQLTAWGDGGGECPAYSVLPAISFFAGTINSVSESERNNLFKEITGISFEEYLTLDLPYRLPEDNDEWANPAKYMLFNDPLLGQFDCFVGDEDGSIYKKYSERIKKAGKNCKFDILFKEATALCDVMELKYSLGIRLRKAYAEKDKETLSKCLKEIRLIIGRVQRFYDLFSEMWFAYNKPQGFEVQDIRFGGLLQRLKTAERRLKGYLDGDICCLEELEETLLDVMGGGKKLYGKPIVNNDWKQVVTTNVL